MVLLITEVEEHGHLNKKKPVYPCNLKPLKLGTCCIYTQILHYVYPNLYFYLLYIGDRTVQMTQKPG